MIEFRGKINPIRFVLLPVKLTAAQAAIYGEVQLLIKAVEETYMRTAITKMTLDNVSAILITARLKSE
jgi:hypothetical protein